MHVVGLDIGGANLKATDTDGRAVSVAFPVWQRPEELSSAVRDLIAEFSLPDLLAVTMTAELADCFRTKAEGVASVLRAVTDATGETPVCVWQTGAEFVSPEVAREIPSLIAAANWHALATFAGRLLPEESSAILVDVGSTTTDVIPLLDGVPVPRGLTDVDRLLTGELVYTGVRRTPVMAVSPDVPLRGGRCPLAAELFATMHDVYLWRGDLTEDPNDRDTANGRPATREHAHDRLSRMLCCDSTEISESECDQIAASLADAQLEQLSGAVCRVADTLPGPVDHVLCSGSGSFLATTVAAKSLATSDASQISLREIFTGAIAEAACAFAVARLAQERCAYVGRT